jgi:hypothetical protein
MVRCRWFDNFFLLFDFDKSRAWACKAWAPKTEAGGRQQGQEAKKQGQETMEQRRGEETTTVGKKTRTGDKETGKGCK